VRVGSSEAKSHDVEDVLARCELDALGPVVTHREPRDEDAVGVVHTSARFGRLPTVRTYDEADARTHAEQDLARVACPQVDDADTRARRSLVRPGYRQADEAALEALQHEGAVILGLRAQQKAGRRHRVAVRVARPGADFGRERSPALVDDASADGSRRRQLHITQIENGARRGPDGDVPCPVLQRESLQHPRPRTDARIAVGLGEVTNSSAPKRRASGLDDLTCALVDESESEPCWFQARIVAREPELELLSLAGHDLRFDHDALHQETRVKRGGP